MHYCTQSHPDDEDDMEDIPNEFDEGAPALSSQYETSSNQLYSRVSQLLAGRSCINKKSSKGHSQKVSKHEAQRI
jgi:hypothetical protein